jgi:hypothetical protein
MSRCQSTVTVRGETARSEQLLLDGSQLHLSSALWYICIIATTRTKLAELSLCSYSLVQLHPVYARAIASVST